MRTLLPLLVLVLTASTTQAGLRVNGRDLPREQEVGTYCSVCMAVVFTPLLVWLIVGIVSRRLARRRPKPTEDD